MYLHLFPVSLLLFSQLIICGEVSNPSTLGSLIDKTIILFAFSAVQVRRSIFCEFIQENAWLQVRLLPLEVIIFVSNNAIPLASSEFSFSISWYISIYFFLCFLWSTICQKNDHCCMSSCFSSLVTKLFSS